MNPEIIEFPREGLPPRPRSIEQLGILVLDGSGSMSELDAQGRGTKAQAVGEAVRRLISKLKTSSRRQDFWLALIVFGNDVEVRLTPTPVTEIDLPSMQTDPYLGGETSIGDALFAAGNMAEEFLAEEKDLPRSVVIMLMSNSQNNRGRDLLVVAGEIGGKVGDKVNIVSAAYGKDADKDTLSKIPKDPENGFRSTDSAEELRSFFEASIVERGRHSTNGDYGRTVGIEQDTRRLETDRVDNSDLLSTLQRECDQSLENQEYSEAIKSCDRILEIDPNSPYAWSKKGHSLNELGEYREALEHFVRALQLDPNSTDSLMGTGISLRELGNFDEAIECLDKAIEIDPNNFIAWSNKGYTLAQLNRHKQAIECFDRAIENNPNDLTAWGNKGWALSRLGDYRNAIDCFDKVLENNPDDLTAWGNKGWALSRLGDYRNAIDCFDKVLENNPDDLTAWGNKGWALSRLGDYRNAIDCFDKVLENNPDDLFTLRNKGYAHEVLHQYKQATKCYRSALKLDPSDSWTQDAVNRITT
jgi:tetratricopeptide (TPR) repeat protein